MDRAVPGMSDLSSGIDRVGVVKVGDVAVAGTRRPQFSSGAITVIAREQSIVLELLARLERDSGEIAKRRLLQDQVITELAERVAGSERLLYRAVRSLLHDGWETARQQFPGRARTRRLMHQLDGLEPTHPTFAPLVHSVVTRLRRHIAEDRANILPRLLDAATPLSWVEQDEGGRSSHVAGRQAG
jgi:hypothetical protein